MEELKEIQRQTDLMRIRKAKLLNQQSRKDLEEIQEDNGGHSRGGNGRGGSGGGEKGGGGGGGGRGEGGRRVIEGGGGEAGGLVTNSQKYSLY